MNSPAILEILLSLTLQVAVLYLATDWIERREQCDEAKDRLWRTFHILVLVLTALAWIAPHLRLLPARVLINSKYIESLFVWQKDIAAIVLCLWSVGVSVGIVSLILGVRRSLRIIQATLPVEPKLRQSLLSSYQHDLESNGEIELRTCDQSLSPYCWQLSRPIIVLPTLLLQAPLEIARPIVGHELSHLQSGHPLHLFLQRLVEILYWYHPTVWKASRRSALQREYLADSRAVRSHEDTIHYLKGLMLLSRCRSTSLELPAGLAFSDATSQIQERVQHLVNQDRAKPKPSHRVSPLVRLALAAALCMIAWLPVSVVASSRGIWSPWPQWSATALHELGVNVRDYEIDSHRLLPHHHEFPPNVN